jgi:hypothetical protein
VRKVWSAVEWDVVYVVLLFNRPISTVCIAAFTVGHTQSPASLKLFNVKIELKQPIQDYLSYREVLTV